MDVFVKVLRSQESGYSGDVPNKRGKYMLIPQASLDFFPPLSTSTLNDTKTITFKTVTHAQVGLNIVYHNAKYFPQLKQRAHNEVRIYRNSFIDESLGLDRNVIIVALRKGLDNYIVDSVNNSNDDYEYWLNLSKRVQSKGPFDSNEIKNNRLDRLITVLNDRSGDLILNKAEIIQDASKRFKDARQQQPGYENDPCSIMSALFKTQKDFADYLRLIYNNKCALRKTALVDQSSVGLEAAHIKGHAVGGPLLPSNGFLLSADLHKCFDQGIFVLGDDNQVIINSNVKYGSDIFQYAGRVIEPIAGYDICKPYHEYNKYHRDIHFV